MICKRKAHGRIGSGRSSANRRLRSVSKLVTLLSYSIGPIKGIIYLYTMELIQYEIEIKVEHEL